jgi:pimeloyl-ACP methyl ester carboxylesterase
MEIEERSFFFEGESPEDYLYGVHYRPRGAARRLGLVVVPSIGRERLRAYRESGNLARDVARGGFHALRYDPRGEGESSGGFADATVASRARDVVLAVRELRARTGVEEVALLGLQAGAMPAVLAAADAGATRLLLVDPILAPKPYAKNLLRSNIILQSQYFGEVLETEVQLRERLSRGRPVSIYGFQMGLPLLEELERLDLEAALSGYAGRSALLYLAPRQAPPKKELLSSAELLSRRGRSETVCVQLAYSWTSRKQWEPRLGALDDAVCAWLESGEAPPAGGAGPPAPRIASDEAPAARDGLVRQAVEIPTRRGLPVSAVVTRPAEGPAPKSAIVFCQAGLQSKSGVGDYFRWLGDELAHAGHAVVRFDPFGTGDSPGEIARDVPLTEFFRIIQRGDFKDDTLDVLAWTRSTLAPSKVWLWGQCGGCVSATMACAEQPDGIAGLILLAPPVLFSPSEGTVREFDALVARKGYLAKLTSLESYRRFFSGKSEYKLLLAAARSYVREAEKRVRKAVEKYRKAALPDHAMFNWPFFEALQVAMRKRKRVLFLLAEIDNETPEFDSELRQKVLEKRPDYQRLCEIRYLPKADHSLMFEEGRVASRDAMLAWLGPPR